VLSSTAALGSLPKQALKLTAACSSGWMNRSLLRRWQFRLVVRQQTMSDFLLVRGIDETSARRLFDGWKATRKWVRSVEMRDAWEPHELEINRRNAVHYMKGKHKAELANLVLLIQENGGRVIHLTRLSPQPQGYQ
jgi:hypothetical protein